jgi:hypothetical protein
MAKPEIRRGRHTSQNVSRRTAPADPPAPRTSRGSNVEREYLSVAECERMTGRSQWTWRRDAYEGKVASVKLGRLLKIPLSEVRRVMSAGYRPALATELQ